MVSEGESEREKLIGSPSKFTGGKSRAFLLWVIYHPREAEPLRPQLFALWLLSSRMQRVFGSKKEEKKTNWRKGKKKEEKPFDSTYFLSLGFFCLGYFSRFLPSFQGGFLAA